MNQTLLRWLMLLVLFMVVILNAEECFPQCRSGYICHDGECVSLCNPPCSQGEKCVEGECVLASEVSVPNSQNEAPIPRERGMCKEVYIIQPTMETRYPGDFSGDDLLNLSSQLADAVVTVVGGNVAVVSPSDRGIVDECKARCVRIRIVAYHKELGGMGRYSGCLTLSVASYGVGERVPMSEVELTVQGYMRWGDFRPLQKAVDKMCKRIRAELEYKEGKFQVDRGSNTWDEWVE